MIRSRCSRGKRIAAIEEYSIAGYLFFRNMMAERGLYPGRDYSVSFLGLTESMPFLVINGEYDAAVFSEDTYYSSDIFLRSRSELKIIAESIPLPQFPFVMKNGTSPEIEDAVTRALIKINSDCGECREILGALKIKGVKAASDQSYSDFRELYYSIREFRMPGEVLHE